MLKFTVFLFFKLYCWTMPYIHLNSIEIQKDKTIPLFWLTKFSMLMQSNVMIMYCFSVSIELKKYPYNIHFNCPPSLSLKVKTTFKGRLICNSILWWCREGYDQDPQPKSAKQEELNGSQSQRGDKKGVKQQLEW